jgi:hypothetical protein
MCDYCFLYVYFTQITLAQFSCVLLSMCAVRWCPYPRKTAHCAGPHAQTSADDQRNLGRGCRWWCAGRHAHSHQRNIPEVCRWLRFPKRPHFAWISYIYIYVLIAFGRFLEQKLHLLRAIEYLQSKGIKT